MEMQAKSVLIRNTYSRLPLQGFWTWLTGKEIYGRKQGRVLTAVECSLLSTTVFLGGLAASVLMIDSGTQIILIAATILATVSAARYIVATVIHHGVHGAIFKSERNNRILCEVLSTITVVQPYDNYRKFHVLEHHGKHFSTTDDQDLAAIYTLGLKPGVPVKRMALVLLWQCVNPIFHLSYFWGRLRSNFYHTPHYRKLMSVIWLGLLVWVSAEVGPITFLLGVLLPNVVLYQICSLLHLVTEHAWLLRTDQERVRDSHVNNSHARFCGRSLPDPQLKGSRWVLAWVSWWLEHLFVHLPTRLLIVQGSLVVHDWHHRAGTNKHWTRAIQLREADVQREAANGKYSYIDYWGIQAVLSAVLTRISQGPAFTDARHLSYRLN